MPRAYYDDWTLVAADEVEHFQRLRSHLRASGHDYGDFDTHDGQETCIAGGLRIESLGALAPLQGRIAGRSASRVQGHDGNGVLRPRARPAKFASCCGVQLIPFLFLIAGARKACLRCA
jgi:hypothetical protein